jgi:ubiquinone/menaquinone biosynthesis C-methylase UbiE
MQLMTETPDAQAPASPEELRARLHAMWDAVAAGWEANASFVEKRGQEVTARMLAAVAPAPGERILELACGTGGPGFAAAGLVEPGGEVIVSDVSPAMSEFARRRAAALGLGNVHTLVLDLAEIDQPDGAFDVVLCREGLMLAADPLRAAREIRRVMRPGGRLALSVWGARERNPWLAVVFEVVGEQLGVPMPPPGMPHPFSLEDAGRLAGILTEAELGGVTVSELATPYHARSVQEWWERTALLAGPLAKRLAALEPRETKELSQRAALAAERYVTPSGLEFPGVSLMATARREAA